MLPVRNTNIDIKQEIDVIPTLTYKMNLFGDIISGNIDNLDAMTQAIYKILNTERYQYPIYSWNYGIEIKDLFGKPKNYCRVELTKRIEEALLQDERILAVESFSFIDVNRETLAVTFIAKTIYGNTTIHKEVKI